MWDFLEDVINILSDNLEHFLNKFIGKPSDGDISWSLDQILRAECTHWLISGFLASLVLLLLISTTSLLGKSDKLDRSIYLYYFSLSYFVSVLVHIGIDAFSTIA